VLLPYDPLLGFVHGARGGGVHGVGWLNVPVGADVAALGHSFRKVKMYEAKRQPRT
jgi:hypothetical protein